MKGSLLHRLLNEFNGKWLIFFLSLEIVLLVGKDYQRNGSGQDSLHTLSIKGYVRMNGQENHRPHVNTTDILKRQSNLTTRIKATNAGYTLLKENTKNSNEAHQEKETTEKMLHLPKCNIDLCPRRFPNHERKAVGFNDDKLPSIQYIHSSSDLIICQSYEKLPKEKARQFCKKLGTLQKEQNLTSYWSLHKDDRFRLSSFILNEMGYEQRVPNVIGLGVKKCGSGAMRKLLGYHPQIKSCNGEVSFFGKEEKISKGLDYYRSRSLFSKEGDITFEKSPSYFENSDVVSNQMKQMLSENTKFYLGVRDPVERVISDFRHVRNSKYRKAPTKTVTVFTAASEGELFVEQLFDKNGNIVTNNPIVHLSYYARHLKMFLQYFPLSSFHIEDATEIRERPIGALQRMEKFLDIDDFFREEMIVETHDNGLVTCLHINGEDKCSRQTNLNYPKPYVNETILKKLRDYFRPLNKEFEAITGQKFPWTLL